MEQHTELFSSARRHFEPWSGALCAAGIKQAPRRDTLRDALEMGSKKDLPQTLRVEAGCPTGSEKRLRRGWSKEKIIAVLARMHRSTDRLAYASARRGIPALVSAAETDFGSVVDCYALHLPPTPILAHKRYWPGSVYFARRKEFPNKRDCEV